MTLEEALLYADIHRGDESEGPLTVLAAEIRRCMRLDHIVIKGDGITVTRVPGNSVFSGCLIIDNNRFYSRNPAGEQK